MKINLTNIENYQNLSLEEKIKKLEEYNFEIPTADYSGFVKKEILDKATADASEWKKKYHETLSEAERKEAIEKETKATMEAELSKYKRGEAVNSHKAKLISLGYDESLANETAEAMVDNDFSKILENQKIFKENLEKKFKADGLKNFERPTSTKSETDVNLTKEQFEKMTLAQKTELSRTNKELFNQLIGG